LAVFLYDQLVQLRPLPLHCDHTDHIETTTSQLASKKVLLQYYYALAYRENHAASKRRQHYANPTAAYARALRPHHYEYSHANEEVEDSSKAHLHRLWRHHAPSSFEFAEAKRRQAEKQIAAMKLAIECALRQATASPMVAEVHHLLRLHAHREPSWSDDDDRDESVVLLGGNRVRRDHLDKSEAAPECLLHQESS
jgi:hypothetical protein